MNVNPQGESATVRIPPSKKIAELLIKIGAVKFNIDEPFTWTSGMKSPIYCDNRIINSIVEVRDAVISEFNNIITVNFLSKTDIIAGVATGGMTYGAIIASRLNLPFIYVRSERKEHGLKKVIEGLFNRGDKAVLIEDHISTGKSSIRAVEYLREEGVDVISLLSIMTYKFKETEQAFKDKNISFGSICDLDTVLEVAFEQESLTHQQISSILRFRENPKGWVK